MELELPMVSGHVISDNDLQAIRIELEARANGFRSAWPAGEILTALHRIEGLLERLPKPRKP